MANCAIVIPCYNPTELNYNIIKSYENLDSDSFDIFTTGLSATNGTAGIISTLSLNCTAIDSITQGDSFRLNILRSGSHPLDTLAGDAQLVYLDLLTIA